MLCDFRKCPNWKSLEQHRDYISVYGMAIKQQGNLPKHQCWSSFYWRTFMQTEQQKMCQSHVSYYIVGSAEPSGRNRHQITGEGH